MANLPSLFSLSESAIGTNLLLCAICNEPVALESSKTDENGRAVHEECYVLKIGPKRS